MSSGKVVAVHRLARLVTLAIAGGGSLVVYLMTLAPSLTWGHWGADGGDFIAAAVVGRMPHPPGFPLYMALAQLAVRVPLGDPAWRLNALSAVLASGTVVLTALTLQFQGLSPWVVLASALTLAFAPLFWSQALITEVYTGAAFFVALALFFAARGRARGRSEWLAVGLAWGMAVSIHATLVLLASLWLVRLGFRQSKERGAMLRFALGFGVGVLPYALLPLLGAWPQPWGDMRTVSGWWAVVSARLYWGYAFGLPWAEWPRRVLAWLGLIARQFTPVGALLVALGATWLWHKRRWEVVGAAAACGLLSLYAIGYGTPDSLVYLVPAFPLVVPVLGAGLAWVIEKGLSVWALLLLPLVLLAWNWRALDLHGDHVAVEWLHRTLDATPPGAVLITVGDDGHLFALWYAQEALGARRDVLVIDRDLWWQESYQQFLFAKMGCVVAEPEDFAAGRPLCHIVGEGVVCP